MQDVPNCVRSLFFISMTILVSAIVLPSASQSCSGNLHLNQIQVVGSHNSYHAGMGPHEMELLRARNPKVADDLDYSHPPLDVQLDRGLRQIELDIYADSKGGRYSHPVWPRFMVAAKIPLDPDFDPQHLFDRPGFKVMHVQDLDYRSNCQPFVECLRIVRRWSQAHAGHLPIFILIETKESRERDYMTVPEPFTPEVFDALDAEILSVFAKDEIITPDQVRGEHETLEDAILHDGWPCLKESRGKVIFLMDQRKAGPAYLAGHPSLRGRILFTNARPGEPDAAFVEVNDPLADRKEIPSLVKMGYIVRTRADNTLREALDRANPQRQAAMVSGAQMVSTDFPVPEKSAVAFPVVFPLGSTMHCNPVNSFNGCSLTEPYWPRAPQ